MPKLAGISRRSLLRNICVGGTAVTTLSVAAASSSFADAKIPKEQVKYQDTPKDGHQCSGCAHFTAPSACQLVDGTISPQGWCLLFREKS